MRHNRIIQSNHLRKHWRERVKTHFDQPGKKVRRRRLRAQKAAEIFPRPASGSLRPIVSCPTFKYNMKVRSGRGFTLQEIKAAGVSKKYARTIGISVDHRRVNKSHESLNRNVERLKLYLNKLVLFPKNMNKPSKKDSPLDVLKNVTQYKEKLFPDTSREKVSIGEVSTFLPSKAYSTIKSARNYKVVKTKETEE